MKILYAGNMVNVGYYHTRELRKNGVDIELVMKKNPPPSSDPFQRDPSLKENPNWIRFYDTEKSSWKFHLLKIMRDKKYDLIHSHVELPIFAYLSRKDFIAQVLGSDLTEMAFSNSLRGRLLRRAYKKARLVVFSTPIDPVLLAKLKVNKTIFMPIIWDLSFFRPKKIIRKEFEDSFIIFHPSNHIWDVKGNNLLIYAFAKFVKKYPDALLITVDHGIDKQKSRNLIKCLGIENKIRFINRLNASELLSYYNMSDVIADQFISDGIGAIGMEALCCEKPLLTSCHINCYKNMHPESVPVLDARSSQEIYSKLEYLIDQNIRNEIGKKSRLWVENNLDPEKIARRYKVLYESVLNGDKIDLTRIKVSEVN